MGKTQKQPDISPKSNVVAMKAGEVHAAMDALFSLINHPCPDQPGTALQLALAARSLRPISEEIIQRETEILDSSNVKRAEDGSFIPRTDARGMEIPGSFIVDDPEGVAESLLKLREEMVEIPMAKLKFSTLKKAKLPVTGLILMRLGEILEVDEG